MNRRMLSATMVALLTATAESVRAQGPASTNGPTSASTSASTRTPTVSASMSITATVVDGGIPCRSKKPWCERERPPTAPTPATDRTSSFAEFLAASSAQTPAAWSARWATGAVSARPSGASAAQHQRSGHRASSDSVFTVFLYY